MESSHDSSDAAILRRRRRGTRPTRECTPDPSATTRRNHSESESSSTFEPVTTVRMQIRPPGAMSAHESKILRRRDKTFANTAARSHSQPRRAERLSSPEANELLSTAVKRSLSSPRHKEESSEGENRVMNPERRQVLSSRLEVKEDTELSRLEQNLRRFEAERKRFELEKRLFEHEKREHKIRCRQYLDKDERKQILDSYRKISEKIQLPTGAEDRRKIVQNLKLTRQEAPIRYKPVKSSGYESSTPLSSESETQRDVQPRQRSLNNSSSSRIPEATKPHVGPPPPPIPIRRSVSRNNSLSPIRPARRSKTPDDEAIRSRKSSIEDGTPKAPERKHSLREFKTSSRNSSYDGGDPLRKGEEGREPSRIPSPLNDIGTWRSERKRSLNGSYVDKDITSTIRRQLNDSADHAMKREATKVQSEVDVLPSEVTDGSLQLRLLLAKFCEFFKRPKTEQLENLLVNEKLATSETLLTKVFIRQMFKDLRFEWNKLKTECSHHLEAMRKLRNKCLAHTIILVLLCGFGGLMFRYTEGSFENTYKCEVRKVKRDFIDHLWTVSHNMREDDWKSAARNRLRKFEEELYTIQALGVRRSPAMKSWNFVNCILYCWTVVTTIGYGHITPQTVIGRSLTVIYAVIGIPMFLILLADFGKLFTRAIKFLWAYVRRIYYTGTCRKVRKQKQVLDVLSGINTMYDYAVRRPSAYIYGYQTDVEAGPTAGKFPQTGNSDQTPTIHSHVPSHPETPSSPYPETIEINDEFNLPISLATFILISYILIGAFVYTLWEDWTYFEAFYFVFISMSTIGFGDFVPDHPIFMMCSIIYLIFGLALTSMFINVVQIKLSDTFKEASAKIGATIGLTMAEGSESHIPTPSDIVSVHQPKLDPIGEDQNENLSSPEKALSGNVAPPLPPKKTSQTETQEEPKKKKGLFRKK